MGLVRGRRERLAGKLLFAAGLLTALSLYALATASATEQWLYSIEFQTFLNLTSPGSATRVWEWTLLVLASPWWVGSCGLAVLALLLVRGWRRRRLHFGRDFGFALITIMVAAVFVLVAAEGGEEFERKNPWTLTDGSEHHIDERLSPDFIHFHTRSDLFDESLLAWMLIGTALLFRFPVSGAVCLLCMIPHGFAKLALGQEWLSTIVLSGALGTTASGAWIAWGANPRHWFEKKSEDVFVRLFWRRLFPPNKQLRARDLAQPRTSGVIRRKMRGDTVRHQRAWVRAVERDLLPVLAPGSGGYRLTDRPSAREAAESASPFVRFLHLDDGRTFVVKMARRGSVLWWKRPGRVVRLATAARNAILLEHFKVPAPHVYLANESVEAGGFVRQFICVEELIEGRPMDRRSTSDAGAAAGLLARLHHQVAPSWGAPGATTSARAYTLLAARQEFLLHLRRISRRHGIPLEEDFIEGLWRRAERMLDAVVDGLPWRLIHGDMTQHNVLFRPGGAPVLIDLVDMRYDLAGPEVFKLAMRIAAESAESRREFWHAYFEGSGMPYAEFTAQGAWSVTIQAVREMAQGRLKLDEELADESARVEAVKLRLKQVCSVDASLFGAAPGETNWRVVDGLFAPITKPGGPDPLEPAPAHFPIAIQPTPRSY